MQPTTIELTSKPIKLWLAISGIVLIVSFCGMVYSFGEADMRTERWFIATVISFGAYRLFRAARWWQHG